MAPQALLHTVYDGIEGRMREGATDSLWLGRKQVGKGSTGQMAIRSISGWLDS